MKYWLIIIFFSCIKIATAGPKTFAFRIVFKQKNSLQTINDSAQFLSPKALARRKKNHITVDSFDLPLNKNYIDSVVNTLNAFKVKNKSKWFNSIVVLTLDSNVNDVLALSFVKSVQLVGFYPTGWLQQPNTQQENLPNKKFINLKPSHTSTTITKSTRGSAAYYGVTYNQIKLTNTDYLHDLGFKGDGILIAVSDIGFSKLDSIIAFDSTRNYFGIKDKFSFVKDTTNVTELPILIGHSVAAMGMMAGNAPSNYVGSAPHASYCAYITEDYAFESPIEEDNWVSMAERADSIGVDLINTSLGYFTFDASFTNQNYTYAQMDGKTTLIARGHNMAVKKGIFCVNSQGNSGRDPINFKVVTPADADSGYAVGITDSFGNFNFSTVQCSNFGPTADGQIKPDGITVGKDMWYIGTDNIYAREYGSSFSGPLLAGGIACLMQALPTLSISTIKKLVHQSSSVYNTPNDSLGYGIPNFKVAYLNGQVLLKNNLQLKTNKEINLYPNPAKEQINISVTYNYFEIIDAQGAIISKGKYAPSININNLKIGVYFLRLYIGKEMVVKCFNKI